MAAAARAAHLLVDAPPVIFADTHAHAMLGPRAEELLSYHRNNGSHLVLASARAAVLTRSRFTEDRVRGFSQYVILGAGLDTYAARSAGPRVFEVDHPDTQSWKRALGVPSTAVYVPVDLTTDPLMPALISNGFNPAEPALVSCLGVTMYLPVKAIIKTLTELATCAPGTELIADYMLPPELRDERGQTYVDMVAPNTADNGEPWCTFFRPEDLTELLACNGFTDIRHVTERDAVNASLWDRSDALVPAKLSMITHARLQEVG
ncbi:SAM-dependent methyltransferase [Kibdelosporangium lantanae]